MEAFKRARTKGLSYTVIVYRSCPVSGKSLTAGFETLRAKEKEQDFMLRVKDKYGHGIKASFLL